ncbi:Putative F0F1 ATP synthase subunit B [Candidatus Fokinia solitaria]|uniref:F0F1 ATP synthase subunit B n=1 Tax=Candidatus Fokinia solitaria TaxID=1802984 RepID=A0A2U8BRF2_9RICK|nr:hypothetical protein [Candidatus Fokinia solitaria]AWD32908.1 Putative F0F1 ATP synthase subunit B [Candidatus Fokinia solitaria]
MILIPLDYWISNLIWLCISLGALFLFCHFVFIPRLMYRKRQRADVLQSNVALISKIEKEIELIQVQVEQELHTTSQKCKDIDASAIMKARDIVESTRTKLKQQYRERYMKMSAELTVSAEELHSTTDELVKDAYLQIVEEYRLKSHL